MPNISQSHICFVRMSAMSRSFDIVAESPASVEQVHAAFGQEDYWPARVAAGDDNMRHIG
jgi:hypothetical protein